MKTVKKILGSAMLVMGGYVLGLSYQALFPEQNDNTYWYMEIVIGICLLIAGGIYISEAPLVKEIESQQVK